MRELQLSFGVFRTKGERVPVEVHRVAEKTVPQGCFRDAKAEVHVVRLEAGGIVEFDQCLSATTLGEKVVGFAQVVLGPVSVGTTGQNQADD